VAEDKWGNVDKFDNSEVLDKLIERLKQYRHEESIDSYSDGCFVEDVMYFVGVSIDEEEYRQADGYRRFVMRYVVPFAKKVNENTKRLFTSRLQK